MASDDIEQTDSGRREARAALTQTRRSAARSATVVASVAESLRVVRLAYADDVIADRLRDIIRGAA